MAGEVVVTFGGHCFAEESPAPRSWLARFEQGEGARPHFGSVMRHIVNAAMAKPSLLTDIGALKKHTATSGVKGNHAKPG